MGKKNTLLYLDENLVKEAKKFNLNISKLTEETIKHHLFTNLSAGGKASIDFGQYLETLAEEKRCFFLPFELDQIELKSIGTIDGLKIIFGKFNVFVGNHETGKTTVVRCITHMLGFAEPNIKRLLKIDELDGKIHLDIVTEEPLILKLKRGKCGEVIREENTKCILLDDPGDVLDDKAWNRLLEYLRKLDSQVILTTIPRSGFSFYPDDVVVDMNIFKK